MYAAKYELYLPTQEELTRDRTSKRNLSPEKGELNTRPSPSGASEHSGKGERQKYNK